MISILDLILFVPIAKILKFFTDQTLLEFIQWAVCILLEYQSHIQL